MDLRHHLKILRIEILIQEMAHQHTDRKTHFICFLRLHPDTDLLEKRFTVRFLSEHLRVHLITGRTHQIRAHLAALGHPILGDDLYGDRDFNRREKARSLRLCAVSLCLDTGGQLPLLDNRTFSIDPPF